MTEGPQLNDIDAPFPALALGDECLCFSDLPGKLHLGKASSFARLAENLEEDNVTGRVDGFFHCVRERNGTKLLAEYRIVQNRLC
jgi:hypothetical protein